MKVYFESPLTIVTDKILEHRGTVYQINQITHMDIDNDSSYQKSKYESEKSKKYSKYFWGAVLVFIGILTNDVPFIMWIFLIIGIINLMIGITIIPELEETTYVINLAFSNGKRTEIYGDEKSIIDLRDALAKAMHT